MNRFAKLVRLAGARASGEAFPAHFSLKQLPESLTKQALENSLSEIGIAIRFSESVYLFRRPGTCYSGPSESVKQSVHRFR
jgi:hypothetical protein